MPERAKAYPPYSPIWDDENPVNNLQVQPPDGLSHGDANLKCGSCMYFHLNPEPSTIVSCSGFQYGNGGNLKSATISSEQPLRKKEWKILLTTASCEAET